MILMNFFSRSSRATGPKTRVPTGSPSGEIRTAALSSKRMYEPSRRRWLRRVRTITARTTRLPCFSTKGESGAASLTEAVMMSPRPAYCPAEPPRMRMQAIRRAPELSATSRMVPI